MFRRRFLALGLVATVAACGGGGGGSSAPSAGPGVLPPAPAPSASVGVSSAATAPASFTITIPRTITTGAHTRTPRTIPAGTQSIQFTLVKSDNTSAVAGSQSQVYPLTTTSPGCATTAAGISCTLTLNAPVGTDIYTADVYSSTNAASGTKLGSGSVKLSVQANATNTASLSLSGTIASMSVGAIVVNARDGYLTAAPNVTVYGSPVATSARLLVIAFDAQGNQIIAPDTFGVPVTLSLTGYSGYSGYGAHARRPRGAAPTATPSPVPSATPFVVTAATINVTYAFPNGGPATASSAGTGTVTIESPADRIELDPATVSTQTFVAVVPQINGSPAPNPGGGSPATLPFDILPGTCPAGYSGAPFTCYPTPPSPTPCPGGNVGTAPYCAPIVFTSVGASEANALNTYSYSNLFQAGSASTGTFTFPTLTFPSIPNFAFTTNDASPAWTVTVSADASTAGACSQLVYAHLLNDETLPFTISSNPGTSVFSFSVQLPYASGPQGQIASPTGMPSPSPSPLLHGLTCLLNVAGSGAGSSATGQLTIYVNNVTGTVQ